MIALAHDIPGRLRLTIPHIKNDLRASAVLRSRVRALSGVAAANVNPATGSIIVHYEGGAETRALILGSLGVAAPTAAALRMSARRPLIRSSAPARTDGVDAALERVASALAELFVERAVRVAVAALI